MYVLKKLVTVISVIIQHSAVKCFIGAHDGKLLIIDDINTITLHLNRPEADYVFPRL